MACPVKIFTSEWSLIRDTFYVDVGSANWGVLVPHQEANIGDGKMLVAFSAFTPDKIYRKRYKQCRTSSEKIMLFVRAIDNILWSRISNTKTLVYEHLPFNFLGRSGVDTFLGCQGALLGLCQAKGIKVYPLSHSKWKQYAVGNGKMKKPDVHKYITGLHSPWVNAIEGKVNSDVLDSLGLLLSVKAGVLENY